MASMDSLDVLFEHELRDLYDAERQIVKALPKMIKAASNDELKTAFESHLEETRAQVERLEQVFEACDLRVRGRHCAGMAGIIEEGSDLISEGGEDAVLDAGLIAAAQRVEHYEICVYGTLIAWAESLGNKQAITLLQASLKEEKAADQKLTALAESAVNEIAAQQSEGEEGEAPAPARTRTAGRR
jgi:ferritin-like metal-binding protein YciE